MFDKASLLVDAKQAAMATCQLAYKTHKKVVVFNFEFHSSTLVDVSDSDCMKKVLVNLRFSLCFNKIGRHLTPVVFTGEDSVQAFSNEMQ